MHLNILQILPDLNSGGVERGTLEIAQAITNHNHRAFIASNGGALVKNLREMKAVHIKLPLHSKNPAIILANVFRLYKLIKQYNINIVHARSRAPAWSGYIACKLTGTPFITTFHGAYSGTHFLKKRYNSIMLKGDAIIAVSDFIKKHIETRYRFKSSKLQVIYRGVDFNYFSLDKITPQRKAAVLKLLNIHDVQNKKVLLLPTRFTRLKGHIYLVNILKYMKNKNFICIMAGKCSAKQYEYFYEIENTIRSLNLNDKVVLSGNAIEDMPALYSLADVVLSTSLEPESFGRTIIEAQAMNKIVIATNIGGSAEIIDDKITGFLGPVNDAYGFATMIDKALKLEEKKQDKIIKAALKKAHQNYNVELMGKKTIEIYERLYKEKHDKH